MLELYHTDMSVCAQKVRFALAEKGLEWVGHKLDLNAGEAQRPEYLRLNPNGVVPTLVHDGKVVIESTVINEYLDDTFPQSPLRPADPLERARMRLWTKQLDEGIHAAAGILTKGIALRYRRLKKPPEELEAYINAIPNPKKRSEDRESILRGIDSSYFPDAVKRFARLVADMEESLKEAPWLAGRSFSLADIGFAPYILRLEHLQMHFLWHKRRRLTDWSERVREKAGYQQGIVKWLNPASIRLMQEKGAEARPRIEQILAEF